MQGADVPEDFAAHFKNPIIKVVGPPAGVSREHCIEAKALITEEWADDGMGPAWVMFFEPSESDIEVLKSGGRVRLTLRGIHGLIPHSVGVWANI